MNKKVLFVGSSKNTLAKKQDFSQWIQITAKSTIFLQMKNKRINKTQQIKKICPILQFWACTQFQSWGGVYFLSFFWIPQGSYFGFFPFRAGNRQAGWSWGVFALQTASERGGGFMGGLWGVHPSHLRCLAHSHAYGGDKLCDKINSNGRTNSRLGSLPNNLII